MVLYPNKLPESERVCSGICTHHYRLHGRGWQRLHEGNSAGELQAHQGGGETDCSGRVGTHR